MAGNGISSDICTQNAPEINKDSDEMNNELYSARNSRDRLNSLAASLFPTQFAAYTGIQTDIHTHIYLRLIEGRN